MRARAFAIDLFCGAGGMTYGLIQAGYTVLAGVDKEEKCKEIYRQNENSDGSAVEFLNLDLFPNNPRYPDGQQDVAIRKLKSLLKKNNFSKRRGDKLLLAICAPCQPFTKITQIRMSEQRQFRRRHDRNLLLKSVNVIKALRPDAIFCENVEGISGKDQSVMTAFHEELESLNYRFSVKTVDTKRFGIPQSRKRTIGLGYAGNFAVQLAVPETDEAATRKTVKEAIGHLPPLAAGECDPKIPDHQARALSDLNLKRISCAPPGKSNRYLKETPYGDLSLACHRKMKTAGFKDTYTRMSGDELSPTITTKFLSITNGRFGHYDKAQNRGISIKEGALLQTFPEDYVFNQSDMQFSATLIGNAVPPKLAEFFGKHVLRELGVG